MHSLVSRRAQSMRSAFVPAPSTFLVNAHGPEASALLPRVATALDSEVARWSEVRESRRIRSVGAGDRLTDSSAATMSVPETTSMAGSGAAVGLSASEQPTPMTMMDAERKEVARVDDSCGAHHQPESAPSTTTSIRLSLRYIER